MLKAILTIGEMACRLGVSVVTLRRWEREGKLIPAHRTLGGHRRYQRANPAAEMDKTVLYARVSSHDQKSDLERQKQRLVQYADERGWGETELIADLGSGLNFKKRGLLNLIDMILKRSFKRLVVENRDRLLRFGADLVFRICAAQGIEVIIIEDQPRTFEAELARDVLEIITVFSSRLYGTRSAERRKKRAISVSFTP